MQATGVWINAQVDPTLEKKVRILAAHKGVSKSEVLRQALTRYVEAEEKGVKRDATPIR
jgi:predicted transcriptional regulator